LENIVRVSDDESLQTGFKRVNFFGKFWKFSEIIGNYCRGARRRVSSDRFLKGKFFRKLLENIGEVRDDESFQTGSESVNFFCKFLEIIGKYCRDVRRRVSLDGFYKG